MVNYVVVGHEAATLAEQAYAAGEQGKAIEQHQLAAESYKQAMGTTKDEAVSSQLLDRGAFVVVLLSCRWHGAHSSPSPFPRLPACRCARASLPLCLSAWVRVTVPPPPPPPPP
eukprot:COSAG02_NODE_28932_length_579_cov_1.002083_1_plen_113_part_10